MNEQGRTRREIIRRVVQNKNTSHAASRFDTSDIIQETEYQLWQDGKDSFESDYTNVPTALISTIAKGYLAKNFRKHGQAKRNSANDLPLESPVADDTPTPSEIIESRDLIEKLLLVIKAMPEIDQRIYFLRFHCDLSLAQIEKTVCLTRRQLITRLANFKKHIRSNLTCD